MSGKKIFLYVSLWEEHGGAPGLGLYTFSLGTGELKFVKKLSHTISFNCSFVDERRGILYLCNETDVQKDTEYSTGRIYGYQIEKDTGDITELFHRDTYCPNPSYVNITKDGKYMLVSHHSSSTHAPVFSTSIQKNAEGKYVPVITFDDAVVELFTMNDDGSMGELADVQKHTFSEPLYNRYGKLTSCHPHCAVISPSGNLIAVCDKGDSNIYMYKINRENNTLQRVFQCITSEKGCGPRYCVFHPTLPYLFVNHEFIFHGKLSVCAFRYTENGTLEKICECDAVPEDYEHQDRYYQQQGFVIHPNGKYLYSVINGYDSVAVFAIHENTGKIQLIQNADIEGQWPRGVVISPDGQFLLASCLSGEIKEFQIGSDGRLVFTGVCSKLRGSSYFSFYDPDKTTR